jgi:hypothetical protein
MTLATTEAAARALDASTYVPHALHREGQAWLEKNCYVDVWIEAVHALGLEPRAMLASTVTADFYGDQWAFFKPAHTDLRALYGITVSELNVWRPLLHHALHHTRQGNFVFTESDSFYLPDTSGTDYRRNHVKSTIAINAIDVEARKLGYFHNASYYELSGDDFVALFRLDAPPDPTFLPLFAEVALLGSAEKLEPRVLAKRSIETAHAHLRARPSKNPIAAYRAAINDDLELCKKEGLGFYHAYAFAALRQCGASFELLARWLEWLGETGEGGHEETIAGLLRISDSAKAMILKGARAVNAKRAVDFTEMLDGMESSYDASVGALVKRYGG